MAKVSAIPENWHGLTGAQVRDIMTSILQRAEDAANAIENVDNAFVFGYYDSTEGFKDKDGNTIIGTSGVIYYDLGNLPNAYSYSEDEEKYVYLNTDAESLNEILNRLNNFNNSQKDVETVINNKVDKDGEKVLSDNNYSNSEMKKITIVDNLSKQSNVYSIGQLISLTKEDKDQEEKYPAGLYFWNGTDFQRVGGLL